MEEEKRQRKGDRCDRAFNPELKGLRRGIESSTFDGG